jgi:hypothetical protein
VSCRPIRIITTSFSFFRSKGWLEYADPTLRACKGVKMRKTKRFPDLKTISVRVPKQPVVASNGYVPQKLSPLEARYRAFRDAIPMPLTVEDALTLHGRQ